AILLPKSIYSIEIPGTMFKLLSLRTEIKVENKYGSEFITSGFKNVQHLCETVKKEIFSSEKPVNHILVENINPEVSSEIITVPVLEEVKSTVNLCVNTSAHVVIDNLSLYDELELEENTAVEPDTLAESSIPEDPEYIVDSSVTEVESCKLEEKAESIVSENIVEETSATSSNIVDLVEILPQVIEIDLPSVSNKLSCEEISKELQTSIEVSQVTLTPKSNQTPEKSFTDNTEELKSSSLPSEHKEITEEIVSSSSIDSFSEKMARITNNESPSMEKHSQEDENIKKPVVEESLQHNAESVSLECKLSSLELSANVTGEACPDVGDISTSREVVGNYAAASEHHGTERDSANHSPADVMLASPSISSYSDEGSSDSGKGCSDVATPPSRTPASGSSLSGDVPVHSVYEFVLPQHLVGRLIGRHGCFVHQIKTKTNANILIKRHPETPKLKICAVEGAQADIESALEMIRQKFPAKRYPSVTLEQVSFLPPVPTFPVVPEFLQLHLVEGVNNDVILSSLVSAGHFFLQQPTHPTFPALNRLNACMNVCYNEPSAPALPMPTQAGVICVAPAMGGWYRAQVVSAEPESEQCDIKFVDYGGYMTIECSLLRQIRSDFMTLPFQAAECYLACVAPIGGEEEWSKESYAVMEELTHGQVLQAQICTYAEDGLPVVYLYAIHGNQVVLINTELVTRGLADWVEHSNE
ncbi:hypothetical protein L9F63_007819, partial [Diploptera punctata]